jgi:hypothetical protein
LNGGIQEPTIALNIKNPAVQAAARELAQRRGLCLTAAVDEAIEAALESERTSQKSRVVALPVRERLAGIARCCAARPDQDTRSAEEICAYNANGLPA